MAWTALLMTVGRMRLVAVFDIMEGVIGADQSEVCECVEDSRVPFARRLLGVEIGSTVQVAHHNGVARAQDAVIRLQRSHYVVHITRSLRPDAEGGERQRTGNCRSHHGTTTIPSGPQPRELVVPFERGQGDALPSIHGLGQRGYSTAGSRWACTPAGTRWPGQMPRVLRGACSVIRGGSSTR